MDTTVSNFSCDRIPTPQSLLRCGCNARTLSQLFFEKATPCRTRDIPDTLALSVSTVQHHVVSDVLKTTIVGAIDVADEHGTVRVERISQIVPYGLELLAVSAPRGVKLDKGIRTGLGDESIPIGGVEIDDACKRQHRYDGQRHRMLFSLRLKTVI